MSWWNAKYKNGHGEYEITFASKDYEKAKVVEKICQAIIDKRIKSREDLQPLFSGWVSVEDRLPKYGERVLITEGHAVFEASLSISHKWVRCGIGWAEGVTHWMPLPEPPTEEEV